jgi:hypothetical protein
MAAFVVAGSILALLAPFEALRSWLLYDGLRDALGAGPASLASYLLRGDALRAMASTEHSIVLGYVIMVTLMLYLFIASRVPSRELRLLCAAVLVGGLLATFSRGPWVGAVAGVLIVIASGPHAGRRLVAAGAFAAAGLAAALVLPGGEKVLAYLPSIEGGIDDGSVAYRSQLFEVSMRVFWNAPLFGSLGYLGNPEMEVMRQGQGIIDMVNTYLAVALPYGAVGLILFCLPFAYALWNCRSVFARRAATSQDERALGRALLGALVGIMVTIGTVSSIGAVPPLYWISIGLAVGFGVLTTSPVSARLRTPAVQETVGAQTAGMGSRR